MLCLMILTAYDWHFKRLQLHTIWRSVLSGLINVCCRDNSVGATEPSGKGTSYHLSHTDLFTLMDDKEWQRVIRVSGGKFAEGTKSVTETHAEIELEWFFTESARARIYCASRKTAQKREAKNEIREISASRAIRPITYIFISVRGVPPHLYRLSSAQILKSTVCRQI